MKRRIMRGTALAAALVAISVAVVAGPQHAPQVAHAVLFCPVNTDPGYTLYNFPTVAEVTAEIPGLGLADTMTLSGRTGVATAKSVAEGNAATIETELVMLSLTGVSPVFGEVTLSLNAQSCGQINGATVPPAADSFFDVFYRVDVTQPAAGFVTNAVPLRVQATIRSLPPYGQTYIFKGTNQFQGIAPGQITLVKHVLLPDQRPSWTIDDAGPGSVTNGGTFHPASILYPPSAFGGPLTFISCAGLGLLNGVLAGAPFAAGCAAVAPVNNVDAFSYGIDFTNAYDTGYLGFSVAPGSVGLPGTAVNDQATCPSPEPETDEFGTILNNANWMVYDGDGVTCGFLAAPAIQGAASEPAGAPPNDDVDGLDAYSPTVANTNYVGVCPAMGPPGGAECDVFDGGVTPDRPVYFSLAPASPALPGIPVLLGGPASSGDILVCGPPSACSTVGGLGPPPVYLQETTLGLLSGAGPPASDDIDAICLLDILRDDAWAGPGGGDYLFYSLAPTSPSLGVGGFGAGNVTDPIDGDATASDIIFASGAGLGAQIVVDDDTMLGLLSTDNLNALKCVKGLVDVVPGDPAFPANAPAILTGLTNINSVGFPPPPNPAAVQYKDTPQQWTMRETKTYRPAPNSPLPPPQLIEQLRWTIITTPGQIKGQWIPQPGDGCTFTANQVTCSPLTLQNPAINQDDLHFNEVLVKNVPRLIPRNLWLTCQSVGIRNVVIDLEQVPLGADDINPQPAVRFNFNIDCRLPLVPVGGIAEEPDVTALPTVTSSSGRDYATYIAGSAAGIIMLAVGGGWVLRRRRA